ncbi:MAG: hypothetical protein ACRDT0_02965 [Pseudonocardiaceae bacterium]
MSSNDQLDRASIDDETMIYRYRDLLGWPITRGAGGEFTLQTGDTVCAADLPVGLAGEVQATLRLRMLDGPVVLVPGRQHRRMLLARPPDAGPAPPRPVPGIDLRVITEGPVALPPSGTPRGPLRWVVAPSLTRPWLPPLSDIVAAVRAAVSVR